MLIASDYQLANLGHILQVLLGNINIQRTNSSKSLGVHIDERLSWSNHVENISKKISSAIGGLIRARPYVQQDILLLIYLSLIQPLFDYCDVVWDTLSKGLSTKLQRLQNRAARVYHKFGF